MRISLNNFVRTIASSQSASSSTAQAAAPPATSELPNFCCALNCYEEADRECDNCLATFCYRFHLKLNIDADNVLLQALCQQCYAEGVNSGEVQPYEVRRTADSGRAASSSQDASSVQNRLESWIVNMVNKEEIDTDDDAPVRKTPRTVRERQDDDARDEAEYEAYRQRRAETPRRVIGAKTRVIGARGRASSGGRLGPSAEGDRDWERSRITPAQVRATRARMREFSGESRKRKASVPIRRTRSR